MDIATKLHSKNFFDIFMEYSQPDARILEALMRAGEELLSPSTLSDNLKISRVNVTNALNSLESQGYIERSIDKQDRRKVNVKITQVGKVEIGEVYGRVISYLTNMFKMIGEKLTDDFLETVKVIDKQIEN
jgi:DNA-binding MarR family transcriptional regulator